jgi:hypothetical protein
MINIGETTSVLTVYRTKVLRSHASCPVYISRRLTSALNLINQRGAVPRGGVYVDDDDVRTAHKEHACCGS